jgi:hypothetical protein
MGRLNVACLFMHLAPMRTLGDLRWVADNDPKQTLVKSNL